jgi:ubiquinone/menaquinone biosynthesis C-methylase UbiE
LSQPHRPPRPATGVESWSRYWASGALHSCSNAFDANYSDEIREFWCGFFGKLPDGARIMDIGTGNGAVAFLAHDIATSCGRHFYIEAIDTAEIQPQAAAAAHGINAGDIVFRGGTGCEQTGCEDASFDAVSSQYAIEYCDIDAALAELARILKPGGHAGFLMHHAASSAVETTNAELAAFGYLQNEAPLIEASRALLQDLARVAATMPLADAVLDASLAGQRRNIEAMLQDLVKHAHADPHAGFLEAIAIQVARCLKDAPGVGPAAVRRRLDELEEEMTAHRFRLHAVVAAGRTRDGIEIFRAQLSAAGFSPQQAGELLCRGTDTVGWTIRATRAS